MTKIPHFTYEYDDDSNCITIFVDDNELCDYWCDAEPLDVFKEVVEVFEAGMKWQKENAND